jgi:hypothetical protein
MHFHGLVLAALLLGFALFALGVFGHRYDREKKWVPLAGSQRFALVAVGLLVLAAVWFWNPPGSDVVATPVSSTPAPAAAARPVVAADVPEKERATKADSQLPEPRAETLEPGQMSAAARAIEESIARSRTSEAAAPVAAAPANRDKAEKAEPAATLAAAAVVAPAATRSERNSSKRRARTTHYVENPSADDATLAADEPVARYGANMPAWRTRHAFDIRVHNRLDAAQAREHLQFYIEGRRVAELDVDPRRPVRDASIHLPLPGRLRYALRGYTEWNGGKRVPVDIYGCLEAVPGRSFVVRTLGPDTEPAVYLEAH